MEKIVSVLILANARLINVLVGIDALIYHWDVKLNIALFKTWIIVDNYGKREKNLRFLLLFLNNDRRNVKLISWQHHG